jgi:CubicO group peptidase (beta-lactamase class C family)
MRFMTLLLVLALQAAAAQDPIDRAAREGIERGVYPGAVVVLGRRDTVLLARGYGHLTWSPKSQVPDPDSTLYDLASLTKVVATTPAAMLLVEAGKLRLDRPVRDYLPGFQGPGKAEVTVRQLLSHTSGLPAYRLFYERATDAATMRRLVLEEPLGGPPGRRVVYSDLNAMLLGWIVEGVSGQPLDRLVTEQVFRPAGMTQTGYHPARPLWRRMAPVGLWHGAVIVGQVQDQNAARLGGVSGHAGLYSTGSDLGRYAQLLLRGGRTPECRQLFRPETVAAFTRRAAGDRALGWEMRDTTKADNAGTRMSDSAFGHTGYTGTSMWIDPERDLFVIVLTNRVFAPQDGRSITRLKAIRGRVADGAVHLLENMAPAARSRPRSDSVC